jgi:signal transduction histidine kinase
VDAARNLLAHDPKASDAMLSEVKTQAQAAIGDIRRLVYELRPPTLDQLGLVSALQEYITSQNATNRLRLVLNAPEKLPLLPAAVEVAAYRIVLEALTNVARHSQAQSCLVNLYLEEGGPATADEAPCLIGGEATRLVLEIRDDGVGLPVQVQPGVGLTSMRERAEELGGTFTVTSNPASGTQLLVLLPFPIPTSGIIA